MTNANAVAGMVERMEPDTDSKVRKPEMQMFKYLGDSGENTVRCVIREDGEPLFVAADVCKVLEIANPRDAVSTLDEDEKGVAITDTLGGNQSMTVVTESGLYSLILRSRKPEAKTFKRWVTHDVLPSIRKRGAYLTPTTVEMWLNNPDVMIRMLEEIKTEREKNAMLTAKVKQDAPKVQYHDAVTASEELITVADMAALLKKNGVEIGRDRLFTWMRHNKFLCSRGTDRNRPSYVSQVMGILTCHNTHAADGTLRLQPLVTPKGQTHFLRCFGIITASQSRGPSQWIGEIEEDRCSWPTKGQHVKLCKNWSEDEDQGVIREDENRYVRRTHRLEAKDVAEVLGNINPWDAISRHYKAKDDLAFPDVTEREQEMTTLPERDF